MQNYVLVIFLRRFPYWLLYFGDKSQKPDNIRQNCRFLKIYRQNATPCNPGILQYLVTFH